MKKVICFGLLWLILASIVSCTSNKPLVRSKAQNNDTYKVDYLFEHDGCKVYRFMDNGDYVYFTNCNGDVTSFSSDSTRTRIYNKVRTVDE